MYLLSIQSVPTATLGVGEPSKSECDPLLR